MARRNIRIALGALSVSIVGVGIWLMSDFQFLPEEKLEAERMSREAVTAGEDLPEAVIGPWVLDEGATRKRMAGSALTEADVVDTRNTVVELAPRRWTMRSDRTEEDFEMSVLEVPEPNVWVSGALVQQRLIYVVFTLTADGTLEIDSSLNPKLEAMVWRRPEGYSKGRG